MLYKIRTQQIWLGFGVILATWASYEYSANLMVSLISGAVALIIGMMVLGFYTANQAE